MTEADSKNEVYFSHNENYSIENEDELISDRVHILANNVYQEFELLIKKHGPGTVDGLMPLVVSILETMDKLYTCKDDLSLQLDLIREDQKELYTQYDREKISRRLAEEKINRLEDQFEEERRLLEDRIEFVESNNKLMEMRSRNCRDLITRMEEKEIEIRKEYSNLQLRHSELLKSKVDHTNKHRSLNSQSANEDCTSGHRSPVSQYANRSDVLGKLEITEEVLHTDKDVRNDETDSAPGENEEHQVDGLNEMSLKDEMGEEFKPKENFQFDNSLVEKDLNFYMHEEPYENFPAEVDNGNDDEDISTAGEFEDLLMGKEIELLIKENQDLVETKTALNIVKDDLINKLDEMTGEMCILREDLRSAIKLKKEFKGQIQELEKRNNELNENIKLKDRRLHELGEEENIIECSINENGVQTKTKFTRCEVARILHERNKYKEELLELQETLRYQSSLMNKSTEKSKKGTIWNIFSSVLSNATAFTTEAFIGSGNDLVVDQLHRNFSPPSNKAICYIQDEHGTSISLPNITHNSPSKIGQKKSIPGSAVRVTNPLLSPPSDGTKPSSFDLVPVDSHVAYSSQQCNSSL